jgi:hypothetical protein
MHAQHEPQNIAPTETWQVSRLCFEPITPWSMCPHPNTIHAQTDLYNGGIPLYTFPHVPIIIVYFFARFESVIVVFIVISLS